MDLSPSDYRNRSDVRCLDAVAAGLGLVLFWPVLLTLAIATRLSSPGKALFRCTRIGTDGRSFVLYKFRSMVEGAAAMGPAVTLAADPRVTRFGRFLRRSKLDELPQLINVLKGDMSLVGPRPEDPRYVARYSREQLFLLGVRPGITSPASLAYRDEESRLQGTDWNEQYVNDVLPSKLALDLDYFRSRSALTDLALVWRTVAALVTRTSSEAS